MKFRKLTDKEFSTFVEKMNMFESLREEIIDNFNALYAKKYRDYIISYESKNILFRHFHKRLSFKKFCEDYSVTPGWARTYYTGTNQYSFDKPFKNMSSSDTSSFRHHYLRKYNVEEFSESTRETIHDCYSVCSYQFYHIYQTKYKKFLYKMEKYAEQPIEFDNDDIEVYDEILKQYDKLVGTLNEIKTINRETN